MASSVLSVSAEITGLPSGSKSIGPVRLPFADAPISTVEIAFASGFNSVTVPTDSNGCIILMNAACTTTKILKGVTGDTGLRLVKTGLAAVLVWDSASIPATLGITSSGADTGLPSEVVFF